MGANSRATIVDNTDVDLDAMLVEKFLDYESFYPDGWKKVIQNDDTNRILICVLFREIFMHFMIVFF